MIIWRILPTFFVVTAFTLIAKLSIVLVILLVAGDALSLQFFLVNRPLCRQVTVVALRLQMLVPELKLGIAVMIKGACLPLFFGMAGFTLIAIALLVTLLLVILLVAGNTYFLKLDLEVDIFARDPALVACVTLGRLVLVTQRVFRILVMIEGARLPLFFRMAGFAFIA